MRSVLVVAAVVAGCASDLATPAAPDPLAALPPPATATTDRFVDHTACAQCHLVADTSPVLHDATGANDSPVLLWRASLMALAARDPYYLAVFELERTRGTAATVDKLCTRCHAPAGSEERAAAGGVLGFADLATGDDPASRLGRDGVTCTACHQIAATDLGTDSSFTGGFSIGYDRAVFGPIANPLTSPMQLIVKYTPTYGTHIAESALCGTCHTVIVPSPSGPVVEQGTFLEWRASSFATQGQSCQSCHVPARDANGAAISTVIASTPATLGPRPLGRHELVGGNTYVLALVADALAWANPGVSADELAGAIARDRAHLATAARLTPSGAMRAGDTVTFTVRVDNLTGHKLPTGYPTRRMWLHVTATANGQRLFESGAVDARGALVDGAGVVLPAQPHRDAITSADQVQVWEAVLVDVTGTPTPRTLVARRYSKDDRILPAGFAPSSTDRERIAAVGVVADPSFIPGSDTVTYQLAGVPAGAAIALDLCFEATRPEDVAAIAADPTAAGARFVALTEARPIAPEILAHAELVAP